MKKPRGFTLIELLVVVVIIGILIKIAIPYYGRYQAKNKRMAAEAFLMDIAQRQVQYFGDNRAYATDLTQLNVSTPVNLVGIYTFAAGGKTGVKPPAFTATAIANSPGPMEQESSITLSIDQTGLKQPSDKW
jgi:type IV pilus assembly protein PilE